MPGARERLLQAAIEYVASHGLGELSLRQLATALGTSHRMLVYHFGSKEDLLVAIIQAVEARQRETLVELAGNAHLPVAEQARLMWQRLADPAMWPHERLFFELYGQALQGRPGTEELLDGIVDAWLPFATVALEALGMAHEEALAHARLGVAVTRGLLLDLLATRNREAVDAAMEAYIDLMERKLGSVLTEPD